MKMNKISLTETDQLDALQLDALIRGLVRRREALQAEEGSHTAGDATAPLDATTARKLYLERRRRDSWFGQGLFADPAWDILLDLYACEVEGRRVSISDASIAACVPATTSLRWLGQMEKLGLVQRVSDDHDRRRVWMILSEMGRAAVEGYLSGERGPRS
jgi:hypothetical protein